MELNLWNNNPDLLISFIALYQQRFPFLRFYYYTAGSGGAGPTILSTSFLLLGEEVVAYNKGLLVEFFFLLKFACLLTREI